VNRQKASGAYLFAAACFVWTGAYCGLWPGRSQALGLALLAIAIGVCGFGIWTSRRQTFCREDEPGWKPRRWLIVSAAGILACAVVWASVRGGYFWVFWTPALLFFLGLGVLRLQDRISRGKGMPGNSKSRSIETWKKLFWVAVAIHVLAAVAVLGMHSGDFIDVYLFQRDGAQAILHGINPYTITHENICTPEEVTRFYPPTVVWDGRLHWGYNYPPASLLFALPGYLLGDVRYSQIAAVLLSALLMVRLRPNRMTIGAACILLLSPLSFWVEMNSWIEPFVLLGLTAAVFAALRRSWWLPLALGVFLASKQFVVVGIPFVSFLQPPGWKQNLKLLAKTAAVAVCITAPLALWDLHSFIQGTVVLFLRAPARLDSLSLVAFMQVPPWVIYGLILSAIVFCLLAAARTPAMYAASFAFVLLIWMIVNKVAFINYYFLIAHSIWLAGAIVSGSVCAPAEESRSR
jgi:hypothetical protein